MAMVGFLLVSLLCFGFPFYWGTMHNGLLMPVIWGVGIAVVFGFRTWQHFDRNALLLFMATLVMTCGVSAISFYLGHVLGLMG